jgi:hypothetical protein
VKTPLQDEGSFKTKANKYWNEASITMPNVKVGSVIEIKYIIKSERNVVFPNFNFQYEIPVNYAEYLTDIPEFYIYKPIFTGSVAVTSETKLLDVRKSYSYKFNQYNNIVFKYVQSIYKATNIPALRNEIYVDNISNYRSSIQHELERTRFPNEEVEDYAITWDGVAKNIFEYDGFGKELGRKNYFEEDLNALLGKTKTDSDKVASIFKFVQNKMTWNQNKDIFTDNGVKQAYANGIGNTAEINFILIAMLHSAGIKVNPVLISTVENGMPVYPNRTVFNSVIAAAEVDGKQVLLDASNKYATTKTLPLEDLNWTGILIKDDETSEEVNLFPEIKSCKNTNLMATIDGTGKIEGKVRITKEDYEAYEFREKYAGINTESYLETMESNLNGIQINDYTVDNPKDLNQPITEDFAFSSANQFDIIANKIYVKPLLFFAQTKNPFVKEKRQMPICFSYPKQEKFNIILEIPEGYEVESLPKPVRMTTPENVASFVFNISASGNKVVVQVTSEINKAMVSAAYYDVLKSFFQQMIDKQNEKIILKKM